MSIQEVNETIRDGGLGIIADSPGRAILFVGYGYGFTANTLYGLGDESALDDKGEGPMSEAVKHALETSGGPVYAITPTTTAGTKSSVTQSGAGPAVTLTGDPRDAYVAQVEITTAGVIGTSKFKYTLDDGETYVEGLFTAATYAIPGTGITLNFAAGTYVLGETYDFTTTAPSYSTSQMNAALDVAFAADSEFGLVAICGVTGGVDDTAKATACAAFAAALNTKLEAQVTSRHKPTRGIIEAPNVADAALVAAFAAVVAPRVSYVAGFARVQSSLTGRINKANIFRVAVARLGKKPIGKDASQVFAEAGVGALPSALLSLERNEAETPALDAARAVTARKYAGKRGFYITDWHLLSETGSDFDLLQKGQIMDEAMRLARPALLDYLSRDLTTKADGSGSLTEGQAQAIDEDVDEDVRAGLVPDHVTNVKIRTNRTNDVIATKILKVKIRVLPKAYPKFIEAEFGFTKQL